MRIHISMVLLILLRCVAGRLVIVSRKRIGISLPLTDLCFRTSFPGLTYLRILFMSIGVLTRHIMMSPQQPASSQWLLVLSYLTMKIGNIYKRYLFLSFIHNAPEVCILLFGTSPAECKYRAIGTILCAHAISMCIVYSWLPMRL